MKSNEFWGLYNASNLWCVERTKRACRETAIDAAGVPWSQCKEYFKIIKVTVDPVAT